jgi:hypothetical protein
MSLAFFIQFDAIIAEPIGARTWEPFFLWYISACGTRAVIVMDALSERLLDFIDRVKYWNLWHGITSLIS